jgi:hypothetical protein
LPYRFGDSTRTERNARPTPPDPPEQLVEWHVTASAHLAEAAQANAAAQRAAATELQAALQRGDKPAIHDAVDAMWRSFYATYTRLQAAEQAWNQLAPLAASE